MADICPCLMVLMGIVDSVIASEDYSPQQLEIITTASQNILEALDLNFPALNDEDSALLRQYIGGNMLLLECLDKAAVPDREAIKDQLLLLPDP